ncbi:MAG TPA: response regulator, partial [Acidimicrobiia bacterium]
MSKTAILSVDDDPQVLAAVARDLRARYGKEHRILRAASGAEGLDVLRDLQARGDTVAVLVADQRMPEMTGTEFLTRAKETFPDAKTVLLTAYADTEAAITAINDIALDHYLLKPWDPPEDRLYPVIDELIDEWTAAHPPPFSGVKVID